MNDYKNIDKIKPETLLKLFREVMDECPDFRYISGTQPFLMSFKNEEFNLYIKNISSAYFSDRDKTTRAQLPIKPEFNSIKNSSRPFVFLGYDGLNDVYVCWNFHIAKERLNVGKSVSFYSRSFFQSEVKEGEFSRHVLKNGDTPVLFKRNYLVEFFNKIHSFFSEGIYNQDEIKISFRNESFEEDFINYLRFQKNLADKSIRNYTNALKGKISQGLQKYFSNKIVSTFYIGDLSVLLELNDKLFKTEEYEELNRIGKNMYSCAFDNYIEFIKAYPVYQNNLQFTSVKEPESKMRSNRKLTKEEVLIVENESMFHNSRIICPICKHPLHDSSFKNHFKFEHKLDVENYDWSIDKIDIKVDELDLVIYVTFSLSLLEKSENSSQEPIVLIEDYYQNLAIIYDRNNTNIEAPNIGTNNNILDDQKIGDGVKSKLLKITDASLLEEIKPDLSSNRILSAAQKIGVYYQDQYPNMELRDWITLAKKCLD